MAVGKVRTASFAGGSDGNNVDFFAVSKRAELITIDFWTQLVLEGRCFHMQVGTEDAPVNTTGAMDDELAWMLVDTQAGTTTLPAFADVWVTTPSNTTAIANAMLEIDRAKARYSSGGTAFVPENLRTDRPRASACACAYVWSTDIVTGTKTAVPGSMEIARKCMWDTTPSTTNEGCDFVANVRPLYTVRTQLPAAIVGVGSLVFHCGCATADTYVYGVLDWAEIPTSSAY
jgi:hypothetical protein